MIKVGTYAVSGLQAAYAAWNATFDTYLTHELYSELNCTFRLVPLLNESAVYTAVSNSTIDLLYTNSGMHVCLEVRFCKTTIQLECNALDIECLKSQRHLLYLLLFTSCRC